MEGKILVAGGLNIDMVVKVDRFPNVGETLVAKNFGIFGGGKGANQAIQIKNLGKEVVLFGKVGNDFFGKFLLDNLKKMGIDTKYVFVGPEVQTGCALITVNKTGNNTIVVNSGANMSIRKDEEKIIEKKITTFDLVLLQLEISFDIVKKIINFAYHNKIFIILNPSPPRKIPSSIIKKCDIIIPNEIEIKILTDEYDIEKAANKLINFGAKNVIITVGEKGCLLITKQEKDFFPAFKVKAVDTTACGDAFCGALATAIVEGKSIKQGIKFAQAAAALVATKIGASSSLPTKQEVEKFLRGVK